MSRKGKRRHSTEEFTNADLSEKIANLRYDGTLLLTAQMKFENLLGLVKKLQDNAENDVKITTLETRIDELEQCSRMDNVLVFGLKVNHTSYSRAVAQSNSVDINENCPVAETNSCEKQVLSFFRSKSVEISKNDISICHTVKTKLKHR